MGLPTIYTFFWITTFLGETSSFPFGFLSSPWTDGKYLLRSSVFCNLDFVESSFSRNK